MMTKEQAQSEVTRLFGKGYWVAERRHNPPEVCFAVVASDQGELGLGATWEEAIENTRRILG